MQPLDSERKMKKFILSFAHLHGLIVVTVRNVTSAFRKAGAWIANATKRGGVAKNSERILS
jgi:hypothetical protein